MSHKYIMYDPVDFGKAEITYANDADALEAVLADRDEWKGRQEATAAILKQVETVRDALKAELDKAQEIAKIQAERIGGYIKTIEDREAERDALAARLAPVEDKALVEIAAKEMDRVVGFSMNNVVHARAAIAAIRPHIEAAAKSDLVEFSKHKSWSLNYKRPFYCDDDDQEQCWIVYEEIGPINDRDWNVIGKGETAAEAIADALKHER